jgi:uroporphyrinogen decarboxylase
MRQAGRYMAEYRAIREQHDFWTVCRTPELATKVTLQPIDRLGVDAAILFSDILVGLPAMGCDVEFRPAPTIADPLRSPDDIAKLRLPDPEKDLGYVLDAIRMLRRELSGRVPLIGFGGAPLTLAAYMVEGGGSKDFRHLKSLLYDEPQAAERLLRHLAHAQALFLGAQIEAGAQAVQIFDTWAGILPRGMFEKFVLAPVQHLVKAIRRPDVPIIYFSKETAHVFDLLGRSGADVLSIDEKTPLSRAAEQIGPGPALQGNLDPITLLASRKVIHEGVSRVLEDVPKDRGHVFNLGHGILPPTPVENAIFLVNTVKELSSRAA